MISIVVRLGVQSPPMANIIGVKWSKCNIFLQEHPMFQSHGVHQLSLAYDYVPNFIGPTLPCADKGDHESYCTTMLTFSKAWHSGHNLKSNDQSWHDAFTTHQFNSDHLTIMNNMKVRYECLDARDDFSIQQRKMAKDSVLQNHIDVNLPENIIDEVEKDNIIDIDVNPEMWSVCSIGKKTAKWEYNRGVIEQIMFSAGWLDELPENHLIPTIPNRIYPMLSWDVIQWKAKVNEHRQDFISNKHHDLTINSAGISIVENPLSKDCLARNDVRIVGSEYLTKTFTYAALNEKVLLDEIVKKYMLNTEQERACRIVAQHVLSNSQEQLKMYLGGMAGTGKSQVINALNDFFVKSIRASQFLLLALTGSAAANRGGSTYHFILSINEKSNTSSISLSTVKENLIGFRYVFIDEVSMLSCHDLYKISAQLAKACDMPDLPFGGKHVIFSGDFSQLPPVLGGESHTLYSCYVGHGSTSGLNHYDQESAIGKALWHQITTIVILRKDMRQTGQSDEDHKFRLALENV